MDEETGFPPFRYLHRLVDNPAAAGIRSIVARHRDGLADVRNTPFRKSIDAERVIAESMAELGFAHSVTNRKLPGLFVTGLNFEVDFFHPEWGVAVEVEKGESGNVWKNICKFAESAVIRHGVLLVPVIRQGQQHSSELYNNTIKRLNHIRRSYHFVDSVMIIGY